MNDDALLEVAKAMADVDHPVKVAASEWARENIGRRDLVEADRESLFGRDDWNACADHGVLATMVPTALGGAGSSLATTLLTLEGLGITPDSVQAIAPQYLWRFRATGQFQKKSV